MAGNIKDLEERIAALEKSAVAEWLTVSQASARFNIHPKRIYEEIRSNKRLKQGIHYYNAGDLNSVRPSWRIHTTRFIPGLSGDD